MKQKQFTFSKHFTRTVPIGILPTDALTHSDSLKNYLVKNGYVVKDVKEQQCILISCIAAKANIPYKERVKLQNKLDKWKK